MGVSFISLSVLFLFQSQIPHILLLRFVQGFDVLSDQVISPNS